MRQRDAPASEVAQSGDTRDAMTHGERVRPMRAGEVIPIALMEYEAARAMQWRLHAERLAERRPDTLVILEHEPVMTLGRTTKPAHWTGQRDVLVQRDIQVRESERGGSVTYHGPGQVVGYPVLRLRNFCSGPKVYVRMLEEVVIRVLAEWGLAGRRMATWPGVWVRDPAQTGGAVAKIAAVGVHIARGVTLHGFALNVTVNLEPFRCIVPCGIAGQGVTSMAVALGSCQPGVVREQVARHFGEVFGLVWRPPAVETAGQGYRPQPPLT